MKKKATRKSAAAKKQTPPKKQAAKKNTTKKKTARESVKKKAASKKTSAKKSIPNETAAKKSAKKDKPDQRAADQHPLKGKSTVFASTRTNEWQPFPLLRIIEDQEIRQEMAARKDELEAQYERAEVAFDLLSKEIELQKLRRENKDKTSQGKDYGDVTGIAISFRTKYRQVLSPLQYVLDVNVSRKSDEGDLKQRKIDPLPQAINGTPVKVREGCFDYASSIDKGRLAFGNVPAHPVDPGKSIFGGQPIAEANQPANYGTLGIVFEMDGKNYGISNKHVTSGNTVRIISADFKSQKLGKVVDKKSKHSDDGHYVDAAYFSLDLLESQGIPSIPYKIKDLDIGNPPLDVVFATELVENKDKSVPIYNYGACTGELLSGKITSIKTQVEIDGTKRGVFRVESYPKPFIRGGNSGSVGIIKATVDNRLCWVVVGIVFGQLMDSVGNSLIPNEHVAFACHISEVLEMLGISDKLPPERLASSWTPVD